MIIRNKAAVATLAPAVPATLATAPSQDFTQQVIDQIVAPVEGEPVARFSSGVTAVYGVSGSGKSSLADTASEYVADRFSQGTMCVAVDPGGWGNRRLSLIRAGVMKVYYPRNHINFFETMEALTLGAWPETIIDPDRGFADPNVTLIKPRQPIWQTKCPQGHPVAQYTTEAAMVAAQVKCPTCDVLVTSQTVAVECAVIRPAMFQQIGLRIFDSLTAMNDMGLIIELPGMSARGELPVGSSGGSFLGGADALRQGTTVFGTGSVAQVGFMQNRTYGWLINIRTIPDQVLGAICTFGVEQSKDDEKTGGELSYGPAVAGKARTAKVPGWVGNCTHATKEPDDAGHVVHRLWLTNHIDPRDPGRHPYLAKHRGTPLGMPDYLQDPWDDDPTKHAELAWSQCSLRRFFELLEAQYATIHKADTERFAKFREDQAAIEAKDEVVAVAPVPVAGGPTAAVTAGGGRTLPKRGLRRAGAAAPAALAPAAAAVTLIQPAAAVTATPVIGEEPAGEPTSETQAQVTPEVAPQPPSPAPPSPPPVPTPVAGPRRLRRSARPPTA
jgi:hypothetical protein